MANKIEWENIIIHHSAGTDGILLDVDQIRLAHQARGWLDVGYHYLAELVGNHYEIICGRLLDMPGAHCKGQNSNSIGICMVGNFEITKPHKQQFGMLVKLCKSLCSQFDIPPSHIYPHKHFANTLCPGKNLDVDNVIYHVTSGLIASDIVI